MQRSWLYPYYSERVILVSLAAVLGLATSAAVLVFRQSFEYIHHFSKEYLGEDGFIGAGLEQVNIEPTLALLLTLPLAGFVVGGISHYIIGHEKHHGVAAIMESVALAGGRLPYKLAPFKALASAISLGAGASLGPEDPSVQIGANLGSWMGTKLRLTEEHSKLLVASGAASAISTAFNAPIAGVFFALEVVLGEFTTSSFGAVVLSSVLAAALTQNVEGANPVFGDLDYTLGHPVQLPFYALLGVVLALISVIVIRVIYWQRHVWHGFKLWRPLKTALVGLIIACIGLVLPEVLGTGEDFMHSVLSGHIETTILLLLLIGAMKLLATAISQGGGFVGGVFAPILLIGIAFGSAYGRFANELIPGLDIGNSQAYAIAGMGGLLAGVVRAPMTSILLVFELTDDYNLILPIMLTSVICTLLIEQIGPPGIYMWSLVKHGLHLHQGRDVDLMQGLKVRDAMLTPPPVINKDISMAELRHSFHQQHTRALCVVDQHGSLVGVVTLGDLQNKFEEIASHDDPLTETEEITIKDICSHNVITVSPEDVLWTAIRLMGEHDIGRLPVVDSMQRPIGLLRRHDVMRAYNLAVARKFHDQHYAGQIRLNTLTGAHVVEHVVLPDSPVRDKQIREIQWPSEVLIASVLRRGKLIIPHGDTTLREQDRVTVVADITAEPVLESLFRNGHKGG